MNVDTEATLFEFYEFVVLIGMLKTKTEAPSLAKEARVEKFIVEFLHHCNQDMPVKKNFLVTAQPFDHFD